MLKPQNVIYNMTNTNEYLYNTGIHCLKPNHTPKIHFMKKQKRFLKQAVSLIALLSFWLCPTLSSAQYWMSKYGYLDNYYLIRDSTDAFFNEDTSRIHDKI